MAAEELLPCRLPVPFRGWFNSVPFQNVGDRIVCQQMSKIGQRSLNPTITPIPVFLRHPSDERRNLSGGSRPSSSALGAAIVLLGDQLSMPSQQCLWRHDGCALSQNLAPQRFRLYSESPALVISEPQSPVANLFTENPIFFNQVIDDVVLMLIHPSGNAGDKK
jgi:hypothetical protein